jgi:predicted DsbA family dithiol-disulfide isomerase
MIVDIFADPTCPWCHVGWASFSAALAERSEPVELVWRPFLLRPDAPAEGVDRAEYMQKLASRDPARWAAMREALVKAAADAGAPLDLEAPKRIPNVTDAHRVLIWATGQGKLAAAAPLILTAYWRDGADIGDPDVLADCAEAAGMDRAVVRDLLDGEADRDLVRAAHDSAARMGVTGVPFVVVARKFALHGANPAAAYAEAMSKAA